MTKVAKNLYQNIDNSVEKGYSNDVFVQKSLEVAEILLKICQDLPRFDSLFKYSIHCHTGIIHSLYLYKCSEFHRFVVYDESYRVICRFRDFPLFSLDKQIPNSKYFLDLISASSWSQIVTLIDLEDDESEGL